MANVEIEEATKCLLACEHGVDRRGLGFALGASLGAVRALEVFYWLVGVAGMEALNVGKLLVELVHGVGGADLLDLAGARGVGILVDLEELCGLGGYAVEELGNLVVAGEAI